MRLGKLKFFVLCVVLGVSLAKYVHATSSSESFVQTATIGNQFEISSSRLALQNSKNDSVKQFAQEMIDDHTQVGTQLKATLASSNTKIQMPNPPLDHKHQKMLDKLKGLSGPEFDSAYAKMQVDAHHESVAFFRDYAHAGDNDALKGFAKKTLPLLKQHNDDAKKLKSSL